ncbi:heme-binding domain-containing protein [Winogradskyella psychrotolerans]|uniref:heme-binding domain-containing protein n=1 Tax=Winogradskyella psychrotolerans TaxID=1344585 RepID=UPI001C07DAB8|nr:heme-binding domain-containing protein [Winogradskyella psychrotolerans]MBU2920750.1 heme-binding domain-containing protein [Winogradskyella psychrotolerans]
MKILKKIGGLLLVVFIVAQFFGPEKNEGDLTSVAAFFEETNPPDDVKMLLKNACIDCHSDSTRYPWYSQITPINYWMADHVKHGSKHLNLSKWNDYDDKRKDHKLEELIEMVESREMPLDSYTWAHSEAKLSQEQIDAMVAWAKMARLNYVFLKEPQ